MPSYRYSARPMTDADCRNRLDWSRGNVRRVARERAKKHPERFRGEGVIDFLIRITREGGSLEFKRRDRKVRVRVFFDGNGMPDYEIKSKQLQPSIGLYRSNRAEG